MYNVTIVLDKVWAVVRAEDSIIHDILRQEMSFLLPSRFYSQKYKNGLWDGRYRFYDVLRRRFMTGFLEEVIDIIKRHGYTVEVLGVDEVFPDPIEIDSLTLAGDDFDQERFNIVQLPLLQGMLQKRRGCVRLGTGGGKTELMAGICKAISEEVLILVHRIESLEQTVGRLRKRLNEPIGEISAQGIDLQRVTVGMVLSVWSKRQSIKRYLKEQVGVVVSNECHRSSSRVWSNVLMVCNAKYRFGLSGTPFKDNELKDRTLVGLTGGVIVGATVKDLVDKGYAVLPEVRIINTKSVLGSFTVNRGDYMKLHQLVYANPKFWQLMLDTVRWHNKSGMIIFTGRIEVCLGIYDFFKKQKDLRVGLSYGGLKAKERLEALNNFRDGKYDVLVTTSVLDEDVDVSSISGVMFATDGKSIVQINQRIGRGVRKDEGKDKVFVYDWMLDAPYYKKHIMKRIDIYIEEQFKMTLWDYKDGQFVLI